MRDEIRHGGTGCPVTDTNVGGFFFIVEARIFQSKCIPHREDLVDRVE